MSEDKLTEHAAATLRCVECATVTEHGLGWRAFLTVDDLDDEDVVEVVTYCPQCAAREFGGP